MKTLIVVAHPNLKDSKVNLSWIKALQKYPEEFDIHNLYENNNADSFDVPKEQELIEKYDKLILQFPVYWFNAPPLMKKWLDEVFLEGWAYGKNNKMKQRKVGLIVTAGIKESSYSKDGRYKHTLEEVLLPFETTFKYMEADYKGFYAFYSAEYESTAIRIDDSIPGMLKFLRNM
ncbi:NAD(P)H-dependent oxidoreductase [Listeria innocua]|uniref:NAD(P)H-dependent oxidoreductase n=1 Tax=Listeria innocua TaxID=1642 RepID=UPI0010B51B4F|nr:NAD(P)H-dependent oxidoreductase [Listeria innocua]EAC4268719.1 flavodoxin family protein [Listeria innocua]ECL7820156.1 NAD(P)H-dependent oxidoreductase [Listeria innocua]ECL7820240.1 NAD(P)H-dependent oxidoreductase [Listeria innocua]ECL7867658.1 NAD(P)H-dependent oxidoreductase [Listeria innocua]ECX5119026.1 NAD(P)H-dependent oxidoreductase [Listeria innocua]